MNRRVNIKRILADRVLHRTLMVRTIVAVQAREGIETTEEEAEQAFDKVQDEREKAGRLSAEKSS